MIEFRVTGKAAAQGSKRHVGKGIMVEMSKGLAPWRERVHWEALRVMGERRPLEGPVGLQLTFRFPRPKTHSRASGELKPGAPRFVETTPDLDKLARAVCDAIAGVVFVDDKQVADLHCVKLYGEPGLLVQAVSLNPEPAPDRLVEASGGSEDQAAGVRRMLSGADW